MGYCPDWQRQNMKKTGSSGPTTTPSRRDMGSLFHSAPAPQSKSMAKPQRLADGDTEESYKERGLKESSGDKVGFFERMAMGNIDQPGSRAYNELGAGRGRSSAAMAGIAAEDEAVRSSIAADRATRAKDDADFSEVDRSFANTRSVTGSPSTPAPTYTDTEFGDLDGAIARAASASTPAPVIRASSSSPVRSSPVRQPAANKPVGPDQSDAETARLARSVRPMKMPNVSGKVASASRAGKYGVTTGDIDPRTLLPKR